VVFLLTVPDSFQAASLHFTEIVLIPLHAVVMAFMVLEQVSQLFPPLKIPDPETYI
jgi:hypothetical protein